MDPRLLDTDEFEIECDIRGIKGNYGAKLTGLVGRLDRETNNANMVPIRAHKAAYYNPNRELRKCQQKLNEHREGLAKSDISKMSKEDVTRTESRLLHLQSRLTRLACSKRYGAAAAEVEAACTPLIQVVQGMYQGGSDELNDTLKQLCSITPYDIDHITDSEDDESDSGDESEITDTATHPKPAVSMSEGHMTQTSSPFRDGDGQNLRPSFSNQLNLMQPSSSNSPPRISFTGQADFQRYPPTQVPINVPPPPIVSSLTLQPGRSNNVVGNPNAPDVPRVPSPMQEIMDQFDRIRASQTNSAETGPTNLRAGPIPNPVNNFNQPQPVPGNRGPFHHPVQRAVRDNRSLSKSKLVYDGSPSGLAIESFLFRLERTADSLGLLREALVDEVACLLKGVAQEWYWCHLELNPVMTWDHLRRDFMARFQDRRTPYDIRRAIENRKQLRKESIIEFYNAIRALTLQSRTVFPETEILHYVRSNMRSGLQLALADRVFISVNELLQCCIALEDTWTRLGHDPDQIQTNRRYVHELDYCPVETEYPTQNEASFTGVPRQPDVPLQSCNQCTQSEGVPENQANINALATRRPMGNPTGKYVAQKPNLQAPTYPNFHCWNCKKEDHVYQQCPLPPQHTFCYGCGRADVVKPNCANCASGNVSRGNRRFGAPTSPAAGRKVNQVEEAASNTDPELFRR